MSTTRTMIATIIQKRRERCFCRLAARRGASMVRCSRWLRRGVTTVLRGNEPGKQLLQRTRQRPVLYAVAHCDWWPLSCEAQSHCHQARYSHRSQRNCCSTAMDSSPGASLSRPVCEVTLVSASSAGPTSDSTSVSSQSRGPRCCSRRRAWQTSAIVRAPQIARGAARRL